MLTRVCATDDSQFLLWRGLDADICYGDNHVDGVPTQKIIV
jgi:hypothetical protein